MPLHIKQSPHRVALVRRVAQEIVCASHQACSDRVVTSDDKLGVTRRWTDDGKDLRGGSTGHRLLRSASDRLLRRGSDAAMGSGLRRGFLFSRAQNMPDQVVEIL